ncbi:MAG: hypothetical protein EPN26_12650 [Rhodospirillales bacterium]|nr:MAG: hypothetical protein EPN26_12650 [Rhodospirillales bacterium]
MEVTTTYRIVVLGDREIVGQTAATPELAKLVPPDVNRNNYRLGMELTEWADHYGKMRVQRTILIEAESQPNEWMLGA